MAFPAVTTRVEETGGRAGQSGKPVLSLVEVRFAKVEAGVGETRGSIPTSGPAFKALFPNGLDAELCPVGASQVASAVALRERLATQPAAARVAKPVPTA